jgi:hypothetical protein
MSSTATKSPQKVGKAAVNKAKAQAAKPWVQKLEHFGYLVRGGIYCVIGLLALLLVLGIGGATTSPTGAIAMLGRQPYGKLFLAVIAVGLAGYALWGFVRAILDPLGRGTSPKGWFERAGFLFSGVSYVLMLIPTVNTLLGKPGGWGLGNAASNPGGSGIGGHLPAILIGLFWVGAGIGQLVSAYTAHYMQYLKTGAMNASEKKMMIWLGRIGYAARGIVFGMIGVLVLRTIFGSTNIQAKGFDGALDALASALYGGVLLGIVALGLILFGVFSGMCSKWIQTGRRQPA